MTTRTMTQQPRGAHPGCAAYLSHETAQQALDAVGLGQLIEHLEGLYGSDRYDPELAQQMLYNLALEGIVLRPKTGLTKPDAVKSRPYAPQPAYAA